jgi:hypothetical protein
VRKLKDFTFKERLLVFLYFIYVLFSFAMCKTYNGGFDWPAFFLATVLLMIKWVFDGFRKTYNFAAFIAIFRICLGLFGYLTVSAIISAMLGAGLSLILFLAGIAFDREYNLELYFYKAFGATLLILFWYFLKDYEYKYKFNEFYSSKLQKMKEQL